MEGYEKVVRLRAESIEAERGWIWSWSGVDGGAVPGGDGSVGVDMEVKLFRRVSAMTGVHIIKTIQHFNEFFHKFLYSRCPHPYHHQYHSLISSSRSILHCLIYSLLNNHYLLLLTFSLLPKQLISSVSSITLTGNSIIKILSSRTHSLSPHTRIHIKSLPRQIHHYRQQSNFQVVQHLLEVVRSPQSRTRLKRSISITLLVILNLVLPSHQ
jgi:hypothetical protein